MLPGELYNTRENWMDLFTFPMLWYMPGNKIFTTWQKDGIQYSSLRILLITDEFETFINYTKAVSWNPSMHNVYTLSNFSFMCFAFTLRIEITQNILDECCSIFFKHILFSLYGCTTYAPFVVTQRSITQNVLDVSNTFCSLCHLCTHLMNAYELCAAFVS